MNYYRPKIYLSQNILSKIWYLCHKINTVEWSGIVFCKTEGHPIEPETFSIRAIDILPMHKGEPTYTEFEIDERVIDAYDNNPELEDCKMGIIHSHVNMGVFFSSTDSSTLDAYAKLSNFCISLIVNNKGEMVAKVAYPLNSKSKRYSKQYKNSEGQWVSIDNKEEEYDNLHVVALDLEVVKEMEEFFVTMTDKAIQSSTIRPSTIYGMHGNYNYDDGYDYDTKTYNQSFNTPNSSYGKVSSPKLFDDKPYYKEVVNNTTSNKNVYTLSEVNSFLCKLLFLDESYKSVDLDRCVSKMAADHFKSIDKDMYAHHMEEKIEDCYKEVFNIKSTYLDLNPLGDFLQDAMEMCLDSMTNTADVSNDIYELIYGVLCDYYADEIDFNNSFPKSNN